jgi:hypothetical protein
MLLSMPTCIAVNVLARYQNISIAGVKLSMTDVWYALALQFAPDLGLAARALQTRAAVSVTLQRSVPTLLSGRKGPGTLILPSYSRGAEFGL